MEWREEGKGREVGEDFFGRVASSRGREEKTVFTPEKVADC